MANFESFNGKLRNGTAMPTSRFGWIFLRAERDALRWRDCFRIDREDGREHFFDLDPEVLAGAYNYREIIKDCIVSSMERDEYDLPLPTPECWSSRFPFD